MVSSRSQIKGPVSSMGFLPLTWQADECRVGCCPYLKVLPRTTNAPSQRAGSTCGHTHTHLHPRQSFGRASPQARSRSQV